MEVRLRSDLQQHEYAFMSTATLTKLPEAVKLMRFATDRLWNHYDFNSFGDSFPRLLAILFGDKRPGGPRGWLSMLSTRLYIDSNKAPKIHEAMLDLVDLLSPDGNFIKLLERSGAYIMQLETSLLPAYIISQLTWSNTLPADLQKYFQHFTCKQEFLVQNGSTLRMTPLEYYLVEFASSFIKAQGPVLTRQECQYFDEFILRQEYNPFSILVRRYLCYNNNIILSDKFQFVLKQYCYYNYVNSTPVSSLPSYICLEARPPNNQTQQAATALLSLPRQPRLQCLDLVFMMLLTGKLTKGQTTAFLNTIVQNNDIRINDLLRAWLAAFGYTRTLELDVLEFLQQNDKNIRARDRKIKVVKHVPLSILDNQMLQKTSAELKLEASVCSSFFSSLASTTELTPLQWKHSFELLAVALDFVPLAQLKHQKDSYQKSRAVSKQIYNRYEQMLEAASRKSWYHLLVAKQEQLKPSLELAEFAKNQISICYPATTLQEEKEQRTKSSASIAQRTQTSTVSITNSTQQQQQGSVTSPETHPRRPKYNQWQAPIRSDESTIMFWLFFYIAKALDLLTLSQAKTSLPSVGLRNLSKFSTIFLMIVISLLVYYSMP